MKRLLINTRGDTIIEVLIAIVILALVLTGAYSSANLSYKNIIDAQQRIQALDVAQNQIEDLREQAATPSFPVILRQANSCFQITPSAPSTNNVPIAFNPDSSPSGPCVSQGIYLSEVSYVMASPNVPPLGSVNEYKITVSWSGLNDYVNNVVLFYRVAV